MTAIEILDDFPLWSLVKDRPLSPELWDKFVCPFCKSEDVHRGGEITTLVGSLRDDPYDSANHKTCSCSCRACGKKFLRERKGRNTWYSQEDRSDPALLERLVAGVASCHESVAYTCAHCGGAVYRDNRGGKSVPEMRMQILSYSVKPGDTTMTPDHRTFYCCSVCEKEVETTPREHWRPADEPT